MLHAVALLLMVVLRHAYRVIRETVLRISKYMMYRKLWIINAV